MVNFLKPSKSSAPLCCLSTIWKSFLRIYSDIWMPFYWNISYTSFISNESIIFLSLRGLTWTVFIKFLEDILNINLLFKLRRPVQVLNLRGFGEALSEPLHCVVVIQTHSHLPREIKLVGSLRWDLLEGEVSCISSRSLLFRCLFSWLQILHFFTISSNYNSF